GETFPEEESLNRAYALRMKGRREEARAAYLSAMAINPGRIDSYNSLAAMAAEEGRWDEARERYAQILGIAPEFADVRRNLGEAGRKGGGESGEKVRRREERGGGAPAGSPEPDGKGGGAGAQGGIEPEGGRRR